MLTTTYYSYSVKLIKSELLSVWLLLVVKTEKRITSWSLLKVWGPLFRYCMLNESQTSKTRLFCIINKCLPVYFHRFAKSHIYLKFVLKTVS